MRKNDMEKNMTYLAEIYKKGLKANFDTQLQDKCLSEKKRYYQKELKEDIDQVLKKLPWMLSVILCNDYLKPVEQDWWTYFYDAGKYYRLKNIAIQAFFHCLYT